MTQPLSSSYLKGTFKVYQECARRSTQKLITNWRILPGSIALYFLFQLIAPVVGTFGMLGGFILGLVFTLFLTFYYSWIYGTARNERIGWKDLFLFDQSLFLSLINFGFLYWLAQFFLEHLLKGVDAHMIFAAIGLLVGVLLNPIPEVIQSERTDGMGTVRASYEFVTQNWIEWFIPFILILIPYVTADWRLIVISLVNFQPLFPVGTFILPWMSTVLSFGGGIISPLIALILTTWFMVFRSRLYQELQGSSRRQRAFKWNQR